jgi:ADP-ribosylglycohydrolase
MLGAIAGDIIGSAHEWQPVASRDFPLFTRHSRFDEDAVLMQAKRSAELSHDHPEGIKGAQSVALAVFLARKGASKEEIRSRISQDFGYPLDRSIADIKPDYHFDVSCQGSVPEAIIAFLESTDFESAVRNAVFLGGDADTQACIAGGIADAFYGGVPKDIEREVRNRLEPSQLECLDAFQLMAL